MGKRKRSRSSNYDKLRKKMKKLQESLNKYKTRSRTTSSSSSIEDGYRSEYSPDYRQRRRNEDDHNSNYQDEQDYEVPEVIALDEEPTLNPTTASEPVPPPADREEGNQETSNIEEGLDPEILQILGEDLTNEKRYGENLHKDIATRWSHILTNGLSKDNKSQLLKEYLPSENCIHMKAPILNKETEAALTEINVKKDSYSQSKQNQLSSCLAAIAKALNWALSSKNLQAQEIIKPLSDAGRLLCDSHYRESLARRYAVLNSNLNKQSKDIIKNTKLDDHLFGANLSEHLKASKAILKSGSEMKSIVQRTPFKQPPTTQNRGALNSKGTPRPAAGEPRQNPVPRRPAAPRDRRHDAPSSYRRPPPSKQRPRRR